MNLLRRARTGTPPRRVRKFLEVGGVDVGPAEINGIIDLRCDGHPLIAVGHSVDIEVLGDDRLVTVGSAVFANVSRAKVRGHYFQITVPGGASCSGSRLPCG